ncbi:sensor histidine kinase [Amycolatopsis oliviviridis]|uniref:histidine kinase n=1 Tax=Amycolatopsis oliviviridis TaxID=1471590 RepID=A0ABQ3L9X1_9PSEU|nr:ATPase [Amycolatopsis oliviviridis]
MADGLLAVFMIGFTVEAGFAIDIPGFRPFDAVGVVLSVLVNAPLAFRRRAPTWVFVLLLLAWAGFLLPGYWPGTSALALLLGLYTVAAHRSVRVTALCAAITLACETYTAIQAQLIGSAWTAVFQSVLLTAVAWTFGANAGRLAQRNGQLRELAAKLRQEQEDRARRAVTEERVRTARELHDVVAHHMSVIAVQAEMARYVFDSNPAASRTALDVIGRTSGEGLDELRRMLTVLRSGEDDETYVPAPGLAGLEELAARVGAAGVRVEVSARGRARSLPDGVELCVYRVVQEALTNVVKHARPASARVSLTYGADEVTVRIADDGRSERSSEGAGHGMIGMRERAELYGGTLVAGACSGGGFAVTLVLPLAADGRIRDREAGGDRS